MCISFSLAAEIVWLKINIGDVQALKNDGLYIEKRKLLEAFDIHFTFNFILQPPEKLLLKKNRPAY